MHHFSRLHYISTLTEKYQFAEDNFIKTLHMISNKELTESQVTTNEVVESL